MKNAKERIYSVVDVADLLGVTPRTVRRYIKRGELRAVALSSSHRASFYVIFQSDLEEFLSWKR